MSLNAPCLNCMNRNELCHAKCELYLSFKKENDKRREERNKYNDFEQEWYKFKEQKYNRLNKRR